MTDWSLQSLVHPGPRRSLIYLAIGAASGLLIAGFGLFTAKGASIRVVPAEDVATVNGKPILLSDYLYQLQTEFGVTLADASSQQKTKVLEEMINEELKVQRGQELDMSASDPEVRMALVNSIDRLTTANVLATPPTETELRAYFDRHLDRYQTSGLMAIRELVVPKNRAAGDEAFRVGRQAAADLRAGADAATVVAKLGLVETGRARDDTFDPTARLHLGERLYGAIAGLSAGQVSDPIDQPDGVHVVVIVRRTPPQTPPFDDVVKAIYSDYRKDKQVPIEIANQAYLKGRAEIHIADGFKE